MIFYVGTNLGLAAAFSFVRLVLTATERRAVTVSFRHQLFISRALLCATVTATISVIWIVRHADLPDLSVANIHFPETGKFSLSMSMLLAALLAVALLKTLRTILQYRELAAVLRSSVVLRRHRRAVIVVSDRIDVPFSLRTLRSRWVVLPSHLLGNREDLRFAIGHELQHHRHGDTSWAWISQALSIVFWPNPVISLWRRWHDRVQEMACDEALVERPGFKVESYAQCLLNVAERALREHPARQLAPSMATPRGDRRATVTHLQTRIEMLFASSSQRLSQPFLAAALAVAVCCGVCVSALAAGLTSASSESVGRSSDVEHGTTNADPDCEHEEDSVKLMCTNESALTEDR